MPLVRLLGAVLAGGRSSRFGSDKALALFRGEPLLAHVAAALATQCDGVVVAGRDWPGLCRVDDVPAPGLGPLGGLAGALGHAAAHGFDAVLSAACDLPLLPGDLRRQLGSPDAVVAGQPTVGLWSARHAALLAGHVAAAPRRSLRGWAERIGARTVTIEPALANLNRPEDLRALERG